MSKRVKVRKQNNSKFILKAGSNRLLNNRPLNDDIRYNKIKPVAHFFSTHINKLTFYIKSYDWVLQYLNAILVKYFYT